jgi:glycosyltransferase involved in cell wall biosynthesis
MLSEHVWAHVFLFFNWMLALAWLRHATAALRGMPKLPDLLRTEGAVLTALASNDGPNVTVIVPACNEEATIQATLRSLLASTGLQLEIVAVDDRSSDRTGARMDAVAAEAQAAGGPHRLEVIHNRELPEGWLGKPHAMNLALKRATAPWLLLTDGDVVFHPHALELSVRYAEAHRADHLVLMLTLILNTTGERAMLAAMNALANWNIRLWKVADPKAKDSFAAGGFNLVRRDVFERLGGFEALRMQVVEDLCLAWKVKHAGYAQHVVLGPGLARIRWLEGPLGVVKLTEKNGFAIFRYRTWLALLSCVGLTVNVVFPLAALATGGWAAMAGALTYAAIVLAYYASRRVTQVSPWLAVFFAPAVAVILFAVLRSILLTVVRGGVKWRGTLYPLAELRRNAQSGW